MGRVAMALSILLRMRIFAIATLIKLWFVRECGLVFCDICVPMDS